MSPTGRPNLSKLLELRAQWRAFHEKQDRVNAEAVFRSAGVDQVTEHDLKFFPHLFRQRLNEFGRDWERTIAAQALREGCCFFRAQMLIGIDEVNALQAAVDLAFGPFGAPLFFESNGLHAIQDGVWDCLFYFVLHPKVESDGIGLDKLPGVISPAKVLRIA